MSQKIRASGALGSPQGSNSNVSGSGIASTSDSCTRENPSIDEPSNDIPSLERVVEFGRRDREALQRAQHVGEPEPDQAHAAFFDAAEHVVTLLVEHVVVHFLILSWWE